MSNTTLTLLPTVLALGLCAAPAAGATLPEPWLVLPWGAGPGRPGLDAGGHERRPVGPTALATDGDALYVVDPVHAQILVLGADARLREAIPTPFFAVDLAALGAGRLAALDARGDRVHLHDGSGAWRTVELPRSMGVRGVAAGPGGTAWAIDVTGIARPVGELAWRDFAPVDRAWPLGAEAPWHAAGRRFDARRGELLLWGWGDPAELQDRGPAARVALLAPEDRLLGLVRPLQMDRSGGVAVLLETLAKGTVVRVRADVRRYDSAHAMRLTHRVVWDVAAVAPSNRYAAVGGDGTLWAMAARADGLALWRIPAHRWQVEGGGR